MLEEIKQAIQIGIEYDRKYMVPNSQVEWLVTEFERIKQENELYKEGIKKTIEELT